MRQTYSKMLGFLLFVLILVVVFAVALKQSEKLNESFITSASLSGNWLFPSDSYLNFAKFDSTHNKNITPVILRDRLVKHPFIAATEVEVLQKKKAKIYIQEKKPIALIKCSNQTFIFTDELQLLPVLPKMYSMNLPVISNAECNNLQVMDFVNSQELVEAYEIIASFKLIDEDMSKALLEVNLNNGKGITLHLSDVSPTIKIGKKSIALKILSLSKIWHELKSPEGFYADCAYVDLTYINQIYLGKTEEIEL